MKWKIEYKQKFIIALVLLVTFLLVILNNLLNKSRMTHLGASMKSVYADRLQVEGLIYQLSNVIYSKKILFMADKEYGNPSFRLKIDSLNKKAGELTEAYSSTVFTKAEKTYFNKLTSNLSTSQLLELKTNVHPAEQDAHQNIIQNSLNLSLNYLSQLSNIQLKEAQLLSEESKQIIAGNEMFSEAEFAFLIVVGIIIQVILLTQHTLITPNIIRKDQLN